jgi:hypothetical protein
MNERIKELERQCWQSSQSDPYALFDVEKFAELIVQECMRMCDVADMSLLEHNCVKEASGTQSAKDFIKEHFGVEE